MQETNETLETTVKVESSSAERLEKERLTRRQALRKMGITTTLSVLALFTADDLARMASKALKQFAGDSKVANQVADEFMNAGTAFAAGPSQNGTHPNGCSMLAVAAYCEGENPGSGPNGNNTTAESACSACVAKVYANYCKGQGGIGALGAAKGQCHPSPSWKL